MKAERIKVECLECGKTWWTSNTLPECPRCHGTDVDLPVVTPSPLTRMACKRCGADLTGRSETLHLMTDCPERRAARGEVR